MQPEVIPFGAQSDDVPQKIEVKKYSAGRNIFFFGWRPHPVLCGGDKLGVIDVLPDHPHEGWINELADINLDADVQIDDLPDDIDPKEYPAGPDGRQLPEVIAWGNTLPDPPYNHEKGVSPSKRFGIIGVYDGQVINLGRIVVDSTWHHWMSINLSGIYAPSIDENPETPEIDSLIGLKEADGDNYKKIITYYRNVAIWLAPKVRQKQMLAYVAFLAVLSNRTFEEWRLDTPLMVLGAEGKDVLGRSISRCFVSQWIVKLSPLPSQFGSKDPECLNCPDIDLMEDMAIGVLLRNMMQLRDEVFSTKVEFKQEEKLKQFSSKDMESRMLDVFEASRKEASAMLSNRLEKEQKIMINQVNKVG